MGRLNILFVNYGDFTTNSLNHLAGYAAGLAAQGHDCAIAVPGGLESLAVVPAPHAFVAIEYAEVLRRPQIFADGRPADILHAWTPRECVRKFVLAYQKLAPTRLVVHLEDDEQYLIETYTGSSLAELRMQLDEDFRFEFAEQLPHPVRHKNLLQLCDGATLIIEGLAALVPPGPAVAVLRPGVDFERYHPQAAPAGLREELGLPPDARVLVYTGSSTFANAAEIRDLYAAVALLNREGTATRLVRTGFDDPSFAAALSAEERAGVIELGFVAKERLPALLALADVLVQPGRPGNFNDRRLPSKLPEFLAMGKPVVLPLSNIGPAVVAAGAGLPLATGTAEEIAAACQHLFRDPTRAAALGEAALAYARRTFDLTHNTAALEAHYQHLLASPARVDWHRLRLPQSSDLSLVIENLELAAPASPASLRPDEIALQVRQIAANTAGIRENQAAALAATRQHADNLAAALETAQRQWEQSERASEERRRLTQQHADNLSALLATQREQAEQRYRELEQQITLSRQHADNLEASLQQCEQRAQTLSAQLEAGRELNERLQTTIQTVRRRHRQNFIHSRELSAQLRRQQSDYEALRSECERIERQREEMVHHLDRLRQTASWKLTMPLRFLRRQLLDRWKRRVQSAARSPARQLTLFSNVDQPRGWQLPCGPLPIRGWCVPVQGAQVTGIRARVGERTQEGVFGLRRADVAAALPTLPQALDCGFTVEISVGAEDRELILELADEQGHWQAFFATPIETGFQFLPADPHSYDAWIEAFDRVTPEREAAWKARVEQLSQRPLLSVLMPVYNPPEIWLERAIASIRAQVYPHWELCIADDASTLPHVRAIIERHAAEDDRIKRVFRPTNGHISAASNSALELVSGEFVALFDHDDELAPHALLEIATLLETQAETDLIYSDEDKIDDQGRRFSPYFKPDYLPDLLTGQNYFSHLSVYRTTVLRALGGFRVGLEGSQDWDLALRAVERISPERIRHVPLVLYHWRAIPGSTALDLNEKHYTVQAARQAITEHLARTGRSQAELTPVPGGHWRVRYPLPSPAPLVSLIIPTRNRVELLRVCVESLLAHTQYPHFEILVVDNDSDDPETLAYLEYLPTAGVTVLSYHGPFNFSAINNFAVEQAQGEFVGLLNNDLEVIHADWLDEMVSQAARPGIGIVGAMLYFPNDTIQHAGVVLGVGGVAGHAFKTFPRGTPGSFNRARLVQNYSAVTAACLVVRKALYQAVGGLDCDGLAVAFNDVDFCLKVQAAGYRNLWTPYAELYHHESASRGAEDTPEKLTRFQSEVRTMQARWGALLERDPAYNPNLTFEQDDFSFAWPPRAGGAVPLSP